MHTEAFSDGLMELVECGAVTGTRKRHNRNKHVATFCIGSHRLYRWLDDNRAIELLPVDEVNHPRIVASEPNFVSINATTEVDTIKNTVDHVVTEYGIARLRGQPISERARRLIAIAHPDHRDQLEFDARKAGMLH